MNTHLANASSVSGSLCIFRNTLRVNGSGKPGARPTSCQALPGNFKSNRPKSSRIHTVPTQHIFQQNARGLKSNSKLTELIDSMRRRNGFSLGLQETWRIGKEEITEDNYTFLGSGPDTQHGRGSCGVGILLSPSATIAWKAAGPDNLHNDLGSRVMAIRMRVIDPTTGKHLGIYMISAYAPASDASEDIKLEFEDSLVTSISRRHFGDILIICADANASLGRSNFTSKQNNTDTISSAIGPHEFNHVNAAGRRLRSFLELHDLAALSSFFKKKHYGTWQHPRSKLQHQLDHIFVSKSDLCRFTNCESCAFGQLVDSDHRCVRCSLRFLIHLQRKRDPRTQQTRLNYAPLLNSHTSRIFAETVTLSLGNKSPTQVTHSQLVDALSKTATSTLPKRAHAVPLWFASNEDILRDYIDQRNSAFDHSHRTPTPLSRLKYKIARHNAQLQVRRAKSNWIIDKCNAVNDGFHKPSCNKSPWDAVKLFKSGLQPRRRAPPPKIKRADGSFATTPAEVAFEFSSFFSNLYGRQPSFDPSVLHLLKQEPCFLDLDSIPSNIEINTAVNKLNASSPGASGLHARLWQALSSTDTGFSYIRHFVHHFWITETPPAEWEIGLLSILPKKGDLSNPGNYRGIMMLEVAYTIIANILLTRLKPIIRRVFSLITNVKMVLGGSGAVWTLFLL